MDYTKENIFYQEGCSARKTGIKRDDCPYSKSSETSRLWLSGWDCENERQQKLGGKRVLR